jgi:hypothetical protein
MVSTQYLETGDKASNEKHPFTTWYLGSLRCLRACLCRHRGQHNNLFYGLGHARVLLHGQRRSIPSAPTRSQQAHDRRHNTRPESSGNVRDPTACCRHGPQLFLIPAPTAAHRKLIRSHNLILPHPLLRLAPTSRQLFPYPTQMAHPPRGDRLHVPHPRLSPDVLPTCYQPKITDT